MTDQEHQPAPARLRTQGSPKICLTFCGSMDPRCEWTTVGDVMALYNVAKRVLAEYENVDIYYPDPVGMADLTRYCVDEEQVNRRSYSTMIFVCGPFGRNNEILFAPFEGIKRLAVGISVLEGYPPQRLADAWHVRDAAEGGSFDLALADIGYPHLHAPLASRRAGQVSLCLVGAQSEYGADGGHAEARKAILGALRGRPRVRINTLLAMDRPLPESVELDVQASEVMVTTRLHGSLISIFHEVPLLAVDQVRGGAKVTRLMNILGHPVVNAWETSPQDLRDRLEAMKERSDPAHLAALKAKLVTAARDGLDSAMEVIRREVV